MSRITSRVKSTVEKCIAEYGDEITIIDRNNNRYETQAIARRPVYIQTLDATYHEYYFLMSRGEFDRITNLIGGKEATPPAWFGDEAIVYDGETYVLRESEPWEYYDGERQVVRIWGALKK